MVSLVTSDHEENPKAISIPKELFHTGYKFNIASYIVMIILLVIYLVFW